MGSVTGSLAVDRALGVGGVPRSRVTEIFGPEGGGKTTLAQHIVAEAQKLKTIVPSLGLSKTALVFINQTRMKIGVMYGNPETTPGGMALKFYASVRMRIAQTGMLGSKGKEYGIRSRVKVVKNKVASPFQEAEFDIEWGKGANQQISKSANQQISESALDSEWQTAEFDVEWGEGINRGREHRPRAGEHQELPGRAPGTDGHDPGGGPGPGGG